ncbi:MAG: helix-turn-helix transcriptional regulator [Elusimicrobiales bacterium]|nr:helix-turn-helix transcriptional regulator [Elusimicrobiales bacterium]
MLLSQNIEYFMKKRDMRQVDLAEKMGVNRSTVSGWVNALKKPDFEYIDKMADAFGVSVSELFVDHYNSGYAETEELEYRALMNSNPDARFILNQMKRMTKKRLRRMRIILEQLAAVEKEERYY